MPEYGNTDRCTGGTASADVESGAPNAASKAFDDNVLTAWATGDVAYPHWIKYDFGVGVKWKISQVKITSLVDNNTSAPYDFTIEGSNNDSDFDVLDTQTSISFGNPETKTFSFVNKIAYRYIKIAATRNAIPNNWCIIEEIEMFEGIYPVAGGFSGPSSALWNFMEAWEKHDKLWKPKGIIIPEGI